jgi:hypothetical protein
MAFRLAADSRDVGHRRHDRSGQRARIGDDAGGERATVRSLIGCALPVQTRITALEGAAEAGRPRTARERRRRRGEQSADHGEDSRGGDPAAESVVGSAMPDGNGHG